MTVERKADENGAVTEIIVMQKKKMLLSTGHIRSLSNDISSSEWSKPLGKRNIWNMRSKVSSVSTV